MKTHMAAIAILVAASCLVACGGEEATTSTTHVSDSADSSSNQSGDTFEPVQTTVDDGAGGELECGSLTAGGTPPDFGDILTVGVDYDGADRVVLSITFAGDAQAKIAERGGTKYSGYVQAEIGTIYPFHASAGTGEFAASPDSLAESFAIEWTSGSAAKITVGGFEEGVGPIVKAEIDTRAPTQGGDVWCDNVTVDL